MCGNLPFTLDTLLFLSALQKWQLRVCFDFFWSFCIFCPYFRQLHITQLFLVPYGLSVGFPGDSMVKDSACNAGDRGLIPGLGRSPGGGHSNPLWYSCLDDHMDRGAWQVHRIAQNQTWLKQLSSSSNSSLFVFCYLRRHLSRYKHCSKGSQVPAFLNGSWVEFSKTQRRLDSMSTSSLTGHGLFPSALSIEGISMWLGLLTESLSQSWSSHRFSLSSRGENTQMWMLEGPSLGD